MKSRFVFRILLVMTTLLFLMGSLPLSPRTRSIPLGVASLTLLLLAAEIALSTWRTLRHPSLPSPAPVTTGPRPPVAVPSAGGELLVFSWVLLCPVFIWSLGFAAGVPFFTVLFLRVRSRRDFFQSVIVAAALWLVIHQLVGGLLELYLYEGWLWKLL